MRWRLWVGCVGLGVAACSQTLPMDMGGPSPTPGTPSPISDFTALRFDRRADATWTVPADADGVEVTVDGGPPVTTFIDQWTSGDVPANSTSFALVIRTYIDDDMGMRLYSAPVTETASTLDRGDLDPAFGPDKNGRVLSMLANADAGYDIVFTSTYELRVVGDTMVMGFMQAALWGFTSDGAVDIGISGTGLRLLSQAATAAFGRTAVVDTTTQNLYIAGMARNVTDDFAIWRLLSDGSDDGMWNGDGLVLHDGADGTDTDAGSFIGFHNGAPMGAGFVDQGAGNGGLNGLLTRYQNNGNLVTSSWGLNGTHELTTGGNERGGPYSVDGSGRVYVMPISA